MADTKISGATALTAPATTDEVPSNSGGASKRITLANLAKVMPGYQFNRVTITATATSTATTAAGAGTAITSGSVTYDGSTVVRIIVTAYGLGGSTDGAVAKLSIWDSVDGDLGTVAVTFVAGAGSAGSATPCYGEIVHTPSAAAHVYTAKIWGSAGTISLFAGAGGAGTVKPAEIRIVRV